MRQMRRPLAAFAAPAVAMGLMACGGEEPAPVTGDGPSAEQTTEEHVSEEPSQDEQSAAEATEDEGSTEAGSPEPTEVLGMWVDDSWEIEQRDDDPCAFSLVASPFSQVEGVFMCGATADSALACALEDTGTAVCISDAAQHRGQRFSSPALAALTEQPAREQEPIPLTVTLPDDVLCVTVAHDHAEHWNGLHSWYMCEDGSELLSEDEIDATFERAETWTVQRSHDGAEPESTAVLTVRFADPATG